MTEFAVYDVFTDHAFGGNQLAVILDATGLPEEQLQKIAREFNFSETTFVYPPSDPAHTAQVRIFTPTMEIPFAGHPTIGTAVALHDRGAAQNMVLELGIGPISCRVDGTIAQFVTTAALEVLATPSVALCAKCIDLDPSAILTTTHTPTQASLGLPMVFVELQDRPQLARCRPQTDAFREGALAHPGNLDFAVFAYVRDGERIDARMFAPLDNIPEDPATGSACATLTALLSDIAGKPCAFTIHQGVDMGRPSLIKTEALAGTPFPIQVTGQAVRTMTGQLTVEAGI
ncbi:MAG: PhzF family phenazine biosynthesis protein [Pseudomonadota bacterium]